MEKKYWSDYAKYLVLSDNPSNKFKGTFIHYQDFLIVKNVINNIAFSDKSTYSYDGDIYKRKISSTEAKNILNNIDKCKWTDKTSLMFTVANQLKLQI